MKKIALALVLVFMVGLFTNCGGGNEPQGANLFIEKPMNLDGMNYEIYCVKFLSPGENSANGTNVWNKCLGTTTIGGYEFYMFRAPRKELDIWVEASFDYTGGAWSGLPYATDRTRVNLKVNDWVKLVTNNHNCVEYRAVDGTGEVH